MKLRPAKVTVNHAWKTRWLACEYTASGDQLECLEDHWDYTKLDLTSRSEWYRCRHPGCPSVFEVPDR